MTTKSTKAKKPFGHDRFIKVRARYLAMLAPFISTEETRYYLNGILIQPAESGGAMLVATDGHRMGIVHDETAVVKKPWICPVKWNLVRAIGKGSTNMAVFAGRHVHLVDAGLAKKVRGIATAADAAHVSEANKPIGGTYPDWQRVVPRQIKRRHLPIAMNPDYIADLIGVLKAAGLRSRSFSFFHTGGQGAPLISRTSEVPEFTGIQMPMLMAPVEALPAWLTADLEKFDVDRAKIKAHAKQADSN